MEIVSVRIQDTFLIVWVPRQNLEDLKMTAIGQNGQNGQNVLQHVDLGSGLENKNALDRRVKGTVMEELIVRDHVRKGKTVQDVLVNGLNGVNAL